MFKNTYQNGLLSIFYSCGTNPLAIWDMKVNNGHIKRLTDNEVNSLVLEIVSTNVATTFISCPKGNQVLGIKLPFLVMIIKNLKRYFSFEITIMDDKNMRRRFRISNFQSTTKIKPFCTSMPIGLSGGWNQIQFNLADFTRRAYGSQFLETQRVQIHANARIRRIYFSDRLYGEEELPQEYKLYLPLERKDKKGKEEKKEAAPATAAPSPSPPPPEILTAAPPPEEPKEVLKKVSEVAVTPASTIVMEGKPLEGEPEEGEAPDEVPMPVEGKAPVLEDEVLVAEDKAPAAEVETQSAEGDEPPPEDEAPGEPTEELPGDEALAPED